MGCKILKPKGFRGVRRKKATPDNTASIPKTNDSIEVLFNLSLLCHLYLLLLFHFPTIF